MKLLVITQKYDINDSNLGAFIDWWDRLAKKFEQIYILALEKQSEPAMPNMEVISMGKEKGAGFLGKIYGFYAGLFKVIGKTDVILVQMIPKYVILAAPVAFFYGKPIYMWYTGVASHWQLKLAVIFCKKIFTAHEAAMRVNTTKKIITGHGIDVNKFFSLREISRRETISEVTILSVGRITPSKGHDFVINAIADLIKSGYNLKLKIIGGVIQNYHKEYLGSLKELVKNLRIEENVEFLGPVSYKDMPEHFQSADILVNAVTFGGLDKVILEAMAMEIIPLTSNSAFSDVFPRVFAGSLIFREKDFEDLKNKLKNILDKKLYQNETLRQELRNIVIEKHNLNIFIDKIAKEMSR
ncbi:MAG: glycosyltransferase family 4 protein [Patescibacteria group bacterium]